MRKISSLVFLALLGLSSYVVQGARDRDLVKSLPDVASPMTSPWYSGYLEISQSKSLHYIFVTSMSDDAKNDPVVVWFNGGPGCSSLLALFQEHGPYVFDDNQFVIKPNPEPWNKRANMLYIESPAGVGYTIAKNDEDWQHNDMSQSFDAFFAIQQFFIDYAEYLPNKLFISGESYGGIYVPYLAWQLHQHNLQAKWSNNERQTYNFQGFIVGNGATDWDLDIFPAYPEVLYNFNMINKETLDKYNDLKCRYYFNDVKKVDNPPDCDKLFEEIMAIRGSFNWYDLFQQTPDGTPGTSMLLKDSNRLGSAMVDGEEKTYVRGYTMKEYMPWSKVLKDSPHHPLLGAAMSDYINRDDVRTALNIPKDLAGWSNCVSDPEKYPKFKYHYQVEGSVWIYPILKAYGYQILFFSGDTDGAVPTLGTRRWLTAQNWPITKEWRPWVTDQQTSGFLIDYDNVKFATVHGVGHMAPQWKRKEVTRLLNSFIHEEDLYPKPTPPTPPSTE